jgi:hypothetical protein
MILQCEVVVECDECGDDATFEINTTNQGFGPDQLKHALRGDGWDLVYTPSGIKTLCPDCNEEEQTPSVPAKKRKKP